MPHTNPLLLCLLALSACAPEVGSDRWCAAMEEKPKGDWTGNEALSYAATRLRGTLPPEMTRGSRQ